MGNILSVPLQQMKEEVIEMNNKILEITKVDGKLEKLYKGCQIYMSPLFYIPKVMYIGINPGSGFFKANRTPVQKFDPFKLGSRQDYENEPWKQIKHCFLKLDGHLDANQYLNTMVKTNYYFFCNL